MKPCWMPRRCPIPRPDSPLHGSMDNALFGGRFLCRFATAEYRRSACKQAQPWRRLVYLQGRNVRPVRSATSTVCKRAAATWQETHGREPYGRREENPGVMKVMPSACLAETGPEVANNTPAWDRGLKLAAMVRSPAWAGGAIKNARHHGRAFAAGIGLVVSFGRLADHLVEDG